MLATRTDYGIATIEPRTDETGELIIDHRGVLHADAVIARQMVLEYVRSDSSVRRELITEQAISDIASSAPGAPVTDNHPEEGGRLVDVHPENIEDHAAGISAMETETVENNGALEVRQHLMIFNQSLIEKIESGEKVEISTRRTGIVIEDEGGEYNGQTYDSKQMSGVVNHTAVVEKGRAGSSVAIIRADGSVNTDSLLDSSAVSMRQYRQNEVKKINVGGNDMTIDEIEEVIDSAFSEVRADGATEGVEAADSIFSEIKTKVMDFFRSDSEEAEEINDEDADMVEEIMGVVGGVLEARLSEAMADIREQLANEAPDEEAVDSEEKEEEASDAEEASDEEVVDSEEKEEASDEEVVDSEEEEEEEEEASDAADVINLVAEIKKHKADYEYGEQSLRDIRTDALEIIGGVDVEQLDEKKREKVERSDAYLEALVDNVIEAANQPEDNEEPARSDSQPVKSEVEINRAAQLDPKSYFEGVEK